ncbi:MAG TPA: NAD(P)/FAD-dependent oxidoreductase [Chthoniobacterales bacterium]|jgi:pyruvate/2-oxoglutarate dehydrogenase complex dihydrolipoamide dehydrogenase (E3) component|nr:NAD(P)/FAD-dependent oxidoreductase [Chthoniobacterales bacterium]
MSYQYQVVVIGSGSAGKEACLKAAKGGLRTLLVEERSLGGTSFFAGSYAVRALRACATYLNRTEKANKVGTNLDLVETSWTNWLTSQRLSSGRLSIEFGEAIDREKIDLKFGRARFIGAHEITITDPQNPTPEKITSQNIIIATGSRPNFPSRPEAGILNSDQLLRQASPARHLFVIGGGYVGCELAAIYRDLGSRVTIAEAQARLLPNWDPIAGEYFRNFLEKAGVNVLLNESIDPAPSGSTTPPAYRLSTGELVRPDVTLVATGRQPNSDDLGLESVGLQSGGWIAVNEHMQTSVDSIYAIGDVTGISLLDSVASAQANTAVDNILGNPVRFDKRWYSQFLHTEPPIANIGWSEEEALSAGIPIEVLNWSGSLFTDDDFTTIEPEHMVVKCVVHAESSRFLGCIAIGSRAAELINLVATSIANGLSAREIAKLSAVHPSATEVLVRMLRNHFEQPAYV